MELKALLNPKARFIFLTIDGLVRAYPIVHVDEHALYLAATQELPKQAESGYFSAAQDSGIVIFQAPKIEALPYRPDETLYRIDFTLLDFSLTNRRLYLRHEFVVYRPVLFNYFGESIVGQITNISEGGLKMYVDRPIRLNIVCHFEIRLTQDFVFKTDGIVVHSGYSDDTERQAAVGISFVAADFADDTEKAVYFAAKKRLAKMIQDLRGQVSA